MTAKDLRQKYLEFFKKHGHAVIKSAPLVPENDPTVLFTTAGMHPLVPFLMGQKHAAGTRLVNYQKCIRTGDIEEVGDNTHLTFFEMLGNWSLGDYFKREAIEFSFTFLTSPEWLGLPLERLAMTVFAGDQDAPFDQESYDHWLRLGVKPERLAKLPKANNWWGPAGTTGPCGPDTEMFYWVGALPAPAVFDPEDKRWVEIWNDVFMQYNKQADGSFIPLSQQNVDTGMGVERVNAVLNGKDSCYDTELFAPIFAAITAATGHASPRAERSGRIVAEHLRSAVFIMADGVTPSNVGQGYVLRRLIRRAIREGRKLGAPGSFVLPIADAVIATMGDVYPELISRGAVIREELVREENQFNETLEKGTREFNKVIERIPEHLEKKVFSGRKAFDLYQTHGFPIELVEEMARERGFTVDRPGFDASFAEHQEKSRLDKGTFKSGLADHSETTTRLHTATHLLHKALKLVLGDHVQQKGSNITPERLRFDFSHPEQVSKADLEKVEAIVNEQIAKAQPVSVVEVPTPEAKDMGALGYFEDRYGDRVTVYRMGDFSLEICAGPHVANTQELGKFKIQKEEASSRGVRRIKAVLE